MCLRYFNFKLGTPESRRLSGPHGYIAQYNPQRATLRRPPQRMYLFPIHFPYSTYYRDLPPLFLAHCLPPSIPSSVSKQSSWLRWVFWQENSWLLCLDRKLAPQDNSIKELSRHLSQNIPLLARQTSQSIKVGNPCPTLGYPKKIHRCLQYCVVWVTIGFMLISPNV